MNTRQRQTASQEVQKAVYGVALSLDAFLLNGIQSGLLQQPVFGDFLQVTARNLLRDLAILGDQVGQASGSQPEIGNVLADLQARCQQMISLVTGLTSFRTLPLPRVCLAVSKIPPLRAECVQMIQALENCLRTRTPFYASRPAHSTSGVDDFLSSLERTFVEEWTASEGRR